MQSYNILEAKLTTRNRISTLSQNGCIQITTKKQKNCIALRSAFIGFLWKCILKLSSRSWQFW